jgi:DNA modification methylase
MELIKTEILSGDCLQLLKDYPNNFFNLIITSPPYADRRNKTYGGIKPDKYVEWFLPRSAEFLRVLKPDGTFILNIKEKAINGERHTYVIELILEMKRQGWLWTEEFVWHKKNCYPGKWPNRFRDAWERCLQFNKSKKFKMYQDKAYPTNVLHFATECYNRNHSAVFPKALPEWFIKLFTQEHDWVLDPFLGSGTTCEAAQELNRNSVGIEILPDYCELSIKRTSNHQYEMCEEQAEYGVNKPRRHS